MPSDRRGGIVVHDSSSAIGGTKAEQLTLKKRLLFVGLTAFISLLILECFSAFFIFRYYSATETSLDPTGWATSYLVKKALNISPFERVESVDAPPMYVTDERLGYTTKPGKYTVSVLVGSKTYQFTITVPRAGVRATSYGEEVKRQTIYAFGDSFIFGWGNNDEQTMPWLLQEKFPQYKVLNLAQSGYGITQAVIQFEQLKDSIQRDDIVILPYADYYNIRNYGPPSFIRSAFQPCDICSARNGRWPVVRSKPERQDWQIDYLNMECSKNGSYCEQKDPDQAVMVDATKRIIDYFANARSRAKIVVAYLNGPENDPVIAHAKQLGMTIVDIRLNSKSTEWDDFGRFDRHPGPIAQYNYFKKMAKGLVDHGIVDNSTN